MPSQSMQKIKSFEPITPMIYAYSAVGVDNLKGCVKIGYTENSDTGKRIDEQTLTSGMITKKEWEDFARYKTGNHEWFTDQDHGFHNYLVKKKGVVREKNKYGNDSEWFRIDGKTSQVYFCEYANKEESISEEQLEYTLRDEQKQAVQMTKDYFDNGGTEFLWNAKPRFGKTLTSYDLVQKMGLKRVLIVTNRPDVSNSWAEDYYKFLSWRNEYKFVSDTRSVKNKVGVISRDEYVNRYVMNNDSDEEMGMLAFVSLEDIKGAIPFGGTYDKLNWLRDYQFDLLIIDESHEGVDTVKTDFALNRIHRKYTLYLSGTPYKALANEQFSDSQIFNWTYVDEQEKKANWDGDDFNPYVCMPRLAMFTYQLSDMIFDKVSKGIVLPDEDEPIDYAFDLAEFFAVDGNGHFIHEDDVKKFIHALTTQEKYPFSTLKLREELSHTMWRLNRVESAKALAKILKEDEVFGEYEIIVAAGDNRVDDSDEAVQKAYDMVKKAIARHPKTITLSVGKLTVGVTFPEWSGVLMLCNLQSASSYMQTVFRIQNPYETTREVEDSKIGERVRKETAYVFDFDPARTLIIFDEFAQKLSTETASGGGTTEKRQENIKKLLNFFPVLGEDSEGTMVELNAEQILSIPRRIKCEEVVRRGFMSNFLFQNISNVFGVPGLKNIFENMNLAHEEFKGNNKQIVPDVPDIQVDENGDIDISNDIIIGTADPNLFGEKYYGDAEETVAPIVAAVSQSETKDEVLKNAHTLVNAVKEIATENVLAPIIEETEISKSSRRKLIKEEIAKIDNEYGKFENDLNVDCRIAETEYKNKVYSAETEEEVQRAKDERDNKLKQAMNTFCEGVSDMTQRIIHEEPDDVTHRVNTIKKEQAKATFEDMVRDHLRGFARTIPSFIMAYGDGNLNLANFDAKVESNVFAEVTGITLKDFRLLRDGGKVLNPNTGEMDDFKGQLFDEIVFNDSVDEFWDKKEKLANYFDEDQEEDIFDYIPPQKTNQIFTPKWVVVKMIDELEENNPGCFDNPDNTFADLYMKSGLYITEIVKRLFRSEKMKELFPDDNERLKHIFEKQVYGMAPTQIIYRIATNYILGFDEKMKSETKNFIKEDTAIASKEGRLAEVVDKYFGKD